VEKVKDMGMVPITTTDLQTPIGSVLLNEELLQKIKTGTIVLVPVLRGKLGEAKKLQGFTYCHRSLVKINDLTALEDKNDGKIK